MLFIYGWFSIEPWRRARIRFWVNPLGQGETRRGGGWLALGSLTNSGFYGQQPL